MRPVTPQSSYGAQKAIGELLVCDMTRKGYSTGDHCDCRQLSCARASRTRPPHRSQAALSVSRCPVSTLFCPVAPATRVWVLSPRAAVANLIIGHEAPASRFAHTRSINVPGLQVGVGEAVSTLRRIAGDAVADHVKWQLDPAINRIVSTWPARFAHGARLRPRHASRHGLRQYRPCATLRTNSGNLTPGPSAAPAGSTSRSARRNSSGPAPLSWASSESMRRQARAPGLPW